MWPFNKKLDTDCMSGTFECRGEDHHMWGHWEPYIQTGTAYSFIFRSGVPFTEKHQDRVCQLCGFIEDKKI